MKKILIIGAGGTGGCIAGFLAAKGENVTLIARGDHLRKIKENGLIIKSGIKGNLAVRNIKCCSAEDYKDTADIIFVCVKSYSLSEVIPLLERASSEETIIIPILNGIGVGDKLAELCKTGIVIDGCMYIAGYIEEAGVLVQMGDIFRVVYGLRKGQTADLKLLASIEKMLTDSGINAKFSDDIERDTIVKFAFVSPFAACGTYYDVEASVLRETKEYKETFIAMVKEVAAIAEAKGIKFEEDIVERQKALLEAVVSNTTASMHKDIKAGKQSEKEELILDVIRKGEALGVPTPTYRMVWERLG